MLLKIVGMSWAKKLLDLLAANHPDLSNSGFAHVANLGELLVEMPYEVAEGLQIRRANPKEIETVKNLILVIHPLAPLRPTRNPYETVVHCTETKPGHMSYATSDMPEHEWRYHVIEFKGTNERLLDFVEASSLTRSRLELGPTVLASSWMRGPAFIDGGSALNHLWEELRHSDEPFLKLGTSELNDLRLVYKKLSVLKDDRVGLRKAMKRFMQLDSVPTTSPLRFLGYVSVLESLVTHEPDPKDPYDSLTRQVRQKMLLLGRRATISIPYEVFDGDVNPETLWTKLYDYRSKIAHGAAPDFERRLHCLKDPATALKFISCATIAVMRQALEEPELVADLRAC